jgi:hypothetical protein
MRDCKNVVVKDKRMKIVFSKGVGSKHVHALVDIDEKIEA